MNFLTEQLRDYTEYRGRKYRICCSFDNVLEVQRLFQDERLTAQEKLEQALIMLTGGGFRIWLLAPGAKAELLEQIYREQISLPKKPQPGKQVRTLDFALDSEYIFASFMQQYHMDLQEYQGRLHWKKFIALFQGLSEDTKIREVMKIRAMDIPEPNKWNWKQRKQIMELKSYYALPVQGGGGQQGLDRLFGSLEALAK